MMSLVLFCAASWAPVCPAADTEGSLPKASKDQPFVNSLGMKFVPVPDTAVLFCIHETRWKDYAAYAAENPGVEGSWRDQTIDGISVKGRAEDHPAIRVSWDDATAFCAWLSRKEGRTYRLPTDTEWSMAVGLGRKETRSPIDTPESLHSRVEGEYPWGTRWPPSPGDGNYSDLSRKAMDQRTRYVEGYNDGYPTTAPVMSFKPNQYELYDMGGNVYEWVEDWFNATQKRRVVRGAAWNRHSENPIRSSGRYSLPPNERLPDYGFRIVVAASAESYHPSSTAAAIIQTDASQPRIEVIKDQGPNATEWALTPLDEAIPADIRQNLTFLREDLLDEGKKAAKSSPEAYKLASDYCDKILAALDQRDLARVNAGYAAAQADANKRISTQALDARRSHRMSWPQFSREESQRAALRANESDKADVKKHRLKVEWTNHAVQMRSYLDDLYRRLRESMR